MTENVREQAEQFADVLRAAPQLQGYYSARTALENDAGTQAMLQRFQSKGMEFVRKQNDRSLTEADIAEMRRLQHDLRDNRHVQTFRAEQQAMSNFLQEVNARLSESLGVDFGALAAPRSGRCG